MPSGHRRCTKTAKPSMVRHLLNRTPLTEAQIRAKTVGDLQPLSDKIQLVEYDPEWPTVFGREAEMARAVLGSRALQIEHIGSTSVPGLPAKPIIDMLLVVVDSADEDAYVPSLEDAGYVLRIREPDWHEHRVLNGPGAKINLHVFSPGCPEIDRVLKFRERLRTNAADRDLYARTKLALADKEWKYVQNYADAKTDVIEEILARAQHEWK